MLLLRAIVGASALLNGAAYLSGGATIAFLWWVAAAVAMVSGACLFAGFLTTVFGAVIAVEVAAVAYWQQASSPLGITGVLPSVTVLLVAVAVALLGPGAYSVDARLFGMREIVIRRSDHPEE